MKHFFCGVLLLLGLATFAQNDTAQLIQPENVNNLHQQQKPYVILISIDGFRHDYTEKHNALYIQQLGVQNSKAQFMEPSFPTLTFPNHYSIATGLYPTHHGLVDNRFFDRSTQEKYSMSSTEAVRNGKWYGGTPLWVLAEEQKMLTASFYWVGTEAAIQGILPTYHYRYSEKNPIENRIQTVVDWLQLPAEKRPHLISFYFPEVDHAGHMYGPDAPQTGAAVRFVDTAIHQLTSAIEKTGLPVNFILVADHGMTKVDTTHPLRFPQIDTSIATIISGNEVGQVYVKNKKDIKPLYNKLKKEANGYSVVLKKDMPNRLHYGVKDDRYNRIGDILLFSQAPYLFVSPGAKIKAGSHGFDPKKVPDMNTVFYAWGPAFRKGVTLPPIKNVDVFPLIAKILGLSYATAIDGHPKATQAVLHR